MGPLSREAAPPPPGEAGAPVLAREMGFRYPSGRPGLAPLDLEVEEGEVVVVLGPNGSGKSTLLRLLATDLRPTSGALRLLGLPAVPPSPALRRRIGYAPDEPVHLPHLTGFENALFFLELVREAGASEPAELMEGFHLGAVAHIPVEEYSFGMRRKLLLVEALATRPDLLLLDEPTVGLDPDGVRTLGERVRALAGEGATVVVATNEVREAPGWATRILFLHEGRVVEDGSPGELRARIPGGTRIQVRLDGPPPELPPLPGITINGRGADGLTARSSDGGRALPALLQALVDAGAGVREVRVREPDLGDLFRELTGGELRPRDDGPEEAEA